MSCCEPLTDVSGRGGYLFLCYTLLHEEVMLEYLSFVKLAMSHSSMLQFRELPLFMCEVVGAVVAQTFDQSQLIYGNVVACCGLRPMAALLLLDCSGQCPQRQIYGFV